MKTVENKYKRYKQKIKNAWDGVPATVRRSYTDASLYQSFAASLIWHIIGGLLFWLIAFSIAFFGLTPKITQMPKDIEFNINSHNYRHIKKVKKSIKNQDSTGEVTPNPSVDNNLSKSTTVTKGQANMHKGKTGNAKTTAGHTVSDFSIPSMSSLKSMTSGLSGSGQGKRHATGYDSSTGSSGLGISSESSSGGNGGFNKDTTRKIISPYDISPYVNELKRNIRWNWKAPANNARVDLFLRIAKDGRIIILNVKRTSEKGDVDNAALNAVKRCVPLNPLPSKYNKGYLDVIFTFDPSTNSVKGKY